MTRSRLISILLLAVLALGGCAQLVAVSVETLLKQGIELFTAGRYDEAIAKFLEVVRRDPTSGTAFLYLARSYVAKFAWADALTSARRALQLAPSAEVVPVLADALLGAGRDALTRGQLPEAIGHLLEYVKLRPTDVQGYLQLGKAYWQNGNLGGALDSYRQALQLSPNNVEALDFLRGRR